MVKQLCREIYFSPLWWVIVFSVSFDVGALCVRVWG
jgi:hypothetical protein